ncbi:atrial natriuretic peptide receptor 1-like [Paramacrobiotus metropolitanus]|uniref:atrial natriuretic peptide receptor 1-like n=1 Tax=Paramacrobiotus metropolitanus TaxID=2943436 RepID=UPI002445B218|nr:atrial natriuretic peptide receptor 1-like [Paramacrobiotus metropolitanus]
MILFIPFIAVCASLSTIAMGNGLIHVVSIVLGGNPAYEYKLSVPTYKLAFQAAHNILGNFSFKEINIFERGISKSCDDEENLAFSKITQIYQLIYQLDGPIVMQTTGCTNVALLLGNFARELNIPMLISTAGDPAFLDKKRFPNTLNFGPADHRSLADGAKQFFRTYQWSTIMLLCGTQYTSAKPFDVSTCSTLYNVLTTGNEVERFVVYRASFNPEIQTDYTYHLSQSKSRARIIVLCLDAAFVRQAMMEAASLNMTNGDYVFLSPQSNVYKNQLDRIWNKNDSNNMMLIQAFKTMIVYANKGPNWDVISDLVQGIQASSVTDSTRSSNQTGIPSVTVNSLNVAAYEAFMVITSMLQENSTLTQHYLSVRERSPELTLQFVQQFWSRHFYLDSGIVHLNAYGYRRTDTVFLRFNAISKRFEEGWFFNVSQFTLAAIPNISQAWPNSSGPPPNRPKCGYGDDECYDDSGQRTILIGSFFAVAGIVLTVTVIIFAIRWSNFLAMQNNAWWLLNPAALFPLQAQSHVSNRTSTKVTDAQSIVIPWIKKYSNSRFHKVRLYENSLVFLELLVHKSTSKPHIPNSRKSIALMNNIKGLLHVNIGTFIGTTIWDNAVAVVWACESRGPLRLLLDAEDIHFDMPMKLSLCWDVLGGIAYLHRSNVPFHGNLSSFTCWVDRRLTVKLLSIGTRRLMADKVISKSTTNR